MKISLFILSIIISSATIAQKSEEQVAKTANNEIIDGKKEGLWLTSNSQGDTLTYGTYENGKREGAWLIQSAYQREIGDFRNGLKNGVWKTYQGDNTPIAIKIFEAGEIINAIVIKPSSTLDTISQTASNL